MDQETRKQIEQKINKGIKESLKENGTLKDYMVYALIDIIECESKIHLIFWITLAIGVFAIVKSLTT